MRGAAIHSVRAVPREQMTDVVAWADAHEAPLHVHLSEQVAENDQCLEAYGVTPTRLLADAGALGPRTSAVHATHLTDDDVRLLAESASRVCLCPTTERDLGDGVPSHRLHGVVPVTVGSDSHAVVDLLEELRAVELHERLATQERGHWPVDDLLRTGTAEGHALARLRRRRPHRGRRPRRPGHPRHRERAHRRHRRRRDDRGVRGLRLPTSCTCSATASTSPSTPARSARSSTA